MDQMALFFFVLGAGPVAVLFVHELGHLLVARHYGMNVLSLSVGFGPPLMNFTDRLGTSWKLKAFPLGGSCVIDEKYSSKNNSAGKQADKLLAEFLRQRAAIYAAGPIFNLIFAASFGLVVSMLCTTCALYGGEIGSPGVAGLRLVAELSVATALFNLLPLLPLDGGRLCLTAIEASLGRRISPTGEKRFFIFSIVFMMGLALAYFMRILSSLLT
jgi:membrane-associated protease RseP (regulator of RpoE activity)